MPAKYLGTEVNKYLAKLSPADANKLKSIPINAIVTGDFKNPKVSTDMKQAVSNLATQLIQQQKDKLITQGTNALGNLINGTKPKDSTKTGTTPIKEDIKTKATDAIKDFFGKKK